MVDDTETLAEHWHWDEDEVGAFRCGYVERREPCPVPERLYVLTQDELAARIVQARAGEGVCSDCGHHHTFDGCSGDPTPSDLWAGVTPAVCDCPGPRSAGEGALRERVKALADEFAAERESAARWASATTFAFAEAMSRKVAWEEAERRLRALTDTAGDPT